MQKRLAIEVRGKVQGVFFRASAKEQADMLGIHGFVQNQPDGSVYAEVEGDEGQVEKFLAWCRTGPRRAHVERVTVEERDCVGLRGFDVRR